MIYQYRYKFYLNANHYVSLEHARGAVHPHCFELGIEILRKGDEAVVSFADVEQLIEEMLEKYQNTLLNEVEPFDEISPTLENIGLCFKKMIEEKLSPLEWIVLSVEVSETPSRSFLITNETF